MSRRRLQTRGRGCVYAGVSTLSSSCVFEPGGAQSRILTVSAEKDGIKLALIVFLSCSEDNLVVAALLSMDHRLVSINTGHGARWCEVSATLRARLYMR